MCGIAGVAFLGTLEHEQEVLRQKLAWYIITELLITTQARGDDATGIATIFNDGNYIGLKMGVMASEFVARKGGKETDYDGFLNVWKKAIEALRINMPNCVWLIAERRLSEVYMIMIIIIQSMWSLSLGYITEL